jgi:hypothetical protein
LAVRYQKTVPRFSFLLRFLATIAGLAFAGCTSSTDSPRPAGASSAPAASAVGSSVRPAPKPRDAYVLLSGGGTPLSNNYSHYLQAQGIAAYFGRECPPDTTWVFFGVGNRAGDAPVLADTRRDSKPEGRPVQAWLAGSLPRNRPATKESFLRALRDEVLPTVRGGGTLYLFVGDHGELAGTGEKRESAITLWQLKRGRRRAGAWYTDEKEVLGVSELRQVLAEGLGDGCVVFCMTQCHSGGFHELGVAREMMAPREWFMAAPAWTAGRAPGVRLRVVGFTATDEASPAAGCEPDPDPKNWAGYERFLPERLLGIDLMTGQTKGRMSCSLAEAHETATLIDHTIDKPRSTSEHYLEAWARLIETRLATTLSLTDRTQQAVAAYQRAVDRGPVAAGDDALRERQAQFERFTLRLVEQVPAAKTLLLAGTRQQLESVVRPRGERGGGGGGGGRAARRTSLAELRKAWNETLRPAWKAAVLGGVVPDLAGAALEFEKHLLELEDGGHNFLLARGGDDSPVLNEIYWNSGYAEPAALEPAKAAAVAQWGNERRARIVAWGSRVVDPQVRAAAEKIGPGPVFAEEPPLPLSRKTAAERVLFYRRVLAAWQFLLTMDARPALAELRTLIELERLPLRRTDR